jgi:hypothetical protein
VQIDTPARLDGNILRTVDLVRHRHTHYAGVGLLLPHQLNALGVEGAEIAVVGHADKDEFARGNMQRDPNSCAFGKLCDQTFFPVAEQRIVNCTLAVV